MRLIANAPSLIIACDVADLGQLRPIAEAAERSSQVGAFKIGLSLLVRHGIEEVSQCIRELTRLPIIYDHQKLGTDIPDLAGVVGEIAGYVDAVIIFPMAGPEVLTSYTKAVQKASRRVIVGGLMTHAGYLTRDGGYIADSAPSRILRLALDLGIRDFVVPATNPEAIIDQRNVIEEQIRPGEYDLYSPGLVAQGGRLEDLRRAAGPRWHAIVGRAVYNAKDPGAAISALANSL